MDSDQLVSEREEWTACGVLEFLAVGERKCGPLAAYDLDIVLVDDVEGVAGQRPDFLLHDESGLLGEAVGWVHTQGRLDWGEVNLCHFGNR